VKYLLIAVGVYLAIGIVAFCIVLILILRDASTRPKRTVRDLDLPPEVPRVTIQVAMGHRRSRETA